MLDRLDTMRGLDQNGNNTEKPQLYGTIHVPYATGDVMYACSQRYPDVSFTYDHVTATIFYHNRDKVISQETVVDGAAPVSVPTPSYSDAQYVYTFAGWSSSNNDIVEENILLGVKIDKHVYAAYSKVIKAYRVRFYNGNTLLQTVTVNAGSNATYTGETPISPDEGFVFESWSPLPENILADTDCYAQFRDTNSPLRQYLAANTRSYSSDTLSKVGAYAFIYRNKLTSFAAPATVIEESAFYGCSALEVVDLTSTAPVTIGNAAFTTASSLTHLIIRSESVATLASGYCFHSTMIERGEGGIYVPDNMVEAYKTATNWSTFAKNIFPISAYPITDFSTIKDSWAEIFAAEENGTYSTKYAVGDTKSLEVGGKTVYMMIAGFNKDTLSSDHSSKAKISWVNMTSYGSRNINSTNDGWAGMEARTWLRETVFPAIQSIVRDKIAAVDKTYRVRSSSVDETRTIEDNLWLLSAKEVNDASYAESDGVVYSDLFTSNYSSRATGYAYVLRTMSQYGSFADIRSDGIIEWGYNGQNYAIRFGFCT